MISRNNKGIIFFYIIIDNRVVVVKKIKADDVCICVESSEV
jgi:hypothetical protein